MSADPKIQNGKSYIMWKLIIFGAMGVCISCTKLPFGPVKVKIFLLSSTLHSSGIAIFLSVRILVI